jgi:hypothetical protein
MTNILLETPQTYRYTHNVIDLLKPMISKDESIEDFDDLNSKNSIDFDVEKWDVLHENRKILKFQINPIVAKTYAKNISWFLYQSTYTATAIYRTWRMFRECYINIDDLTKEVKITDFTYDLITRNDVLEPLIPLYDAFQFLLSGFLTEIDLNDYHNGLTVFNFLNDLDEYEIRSFAQWVIFTAGTSITVTTLEDFFNIYKNDILKLATDLSVPTIGILNFPNNHNLYLVRNLRLVEENSTIIGDIVDIEGNYYHSIDFKLFNIYPNSDLWYLFLLSIKLNNPHLIQKLNIKNGKEDTFKELYSNINLFMKLYEILKDNRKKLLYTDWKMLIKNYDKFNQIPISYSINFDDRLSLDWIDSIIVTFEYTDLERMKSAVNSFHQDRIYIDITEEVLPIIPKNPNVKSLKMLSNNIIRIVLNEPVYPTTIQYCGEIYAEDEPGTVIADMTISAFDLNFGTNTFSRFPEATAYRDEDCKINAKHVNIARSGIVCLGDLKNVNIATTSTASIGTLNDFIQMLRQCNLDSPHFSDKNFVLANPDLVTIDDWKKISWNIPGLTKIKSHLNLISFDNFVE